MHRHACIAVAAGTALIFTGTAIVFNRNSDAEEKAEVYENIKNQDVQQDVNSENKECPSSNLEKTVEVETDPKI